MSQQGADDWWQKLYGTPDPDPAPTPDPGDTLESRFRSASSLTHRVPHQGPPGPAGSVAPGAEPPGAEPPAPPGAAPPPPAAPPGPAPSVPPAAGAGRRPGAVPPEWGPGSVPPVPPVPPVPSVLPRPRREADPEPGPPPRDPREPGMTGYGLGSVTVPPVLPEEPSERPVRHWGARPGPAPGTTRPDPDPEAAAATGPGTRPWREPSPGAGPARDPGSDAEPAAPWEAPGGRPVAGPRPGSEPPAGPGGPSRTGTGPEPSTGPGAGTSADREADAGTEPAAPWEAPGARPGSWPAEAPPAADVTARADVRPLAGDPVAGEPWSGAGVDAGVGGGERPVVGFLGDRAPTYAAEPGALPVADPGALDELVPDTVLEGARHGAYTLRATSVRGDSARFRGEARRDFLLTARFGTGDDALVVAALAGGDRSAPGAAEAAAELCRWIASAVGRSRERLADDIRAGRREALRSGLQRLTDRGYGRLRAHAAELGLPEEAYTAGLRVLLLPIDPECKTRVCFGSGAGGLFRLRDGAWQDLEPEPAGDSADGFRFRAAAARPRDTLLLCSGGLADPMREEALLSAELAARWADPEPPGLASFLADTQLRLKGYADDRTAAAVWEA
ncbi:protein phosphatase 2C domain-containing protein [Streptomyces sp. NPDC051582]|uniref:protein phosphatase 2C domain-containing protein n=1 Tax=Streptomyces sp. NPDC051582 TaxID=3155167 RepID=UPI003429226D